MLDALLSRILASAIVDRLRYRQSLSATVTKIPRTRVISGRDGRFSRSKYRDDIHPPILARKQLYILRFPSPRFSGHLCNEGKIPDRELIHKFHRGIIFPLQLILNDLRLLLINFVYYIHV